MTSLLDQSALTSLAERLVAAARRAGADAADAVAERGVSQSVEVRDGTVEESERSEGDNMGLRVLVGRRQAVVSTNDLAGDIDELAARAVAMARVAPDDKFAGLADPALLVKAIPDLDLLDPQLPSVGELEETARAAEAAGLAVKGVTKSGGASASAGIGGMVLVTSTGFSGAYLGSRHGVSMQAIAGEGTGMERDYDFSSALHAADLEDAGRDRPHRRRARGAPAQSAQGGDQARAGGVRPARRQLADRPSRRPPSTAARSRARPASSRTGSASRSSRPASGSSTIRCAGAACARTRSTPRASPASGARWSTTAGSPPGSSIARPRASSA